ncbi:putative chromatin remodeling complex subunit [Xylariaceae sp. FL0804]|nr:putative chromatin remodeling complex subunit [Xylariaceae sp. FL0804]
MAPSAVDTGLPPLPVREEKTYPPAKIFNVRETKFEKHVAPQPDGREEAISRSDSEAAIVIDNGSSAVRAGWSFEAKPRLSLPPIMAKYRDRKLGKTYSFAGYDCYADTTARGHIRNAFEAGTGIVCNWDVEEHVLDWTFLKLGMNNAEGNIDVPIVMTEAVANLPYSRKSMNEIIFECYGAPSLALGIDSLFSYRYNEGRTGLVVSSSYSSTHVIPVYNCKPMLAQAIRLNWGGWHTAEYLLKLIRLKYPSFPGKLNVSQAEHMLQDHCYVSKSYDDEIRSYLDWTGLEDRDVVIQYPYTEEVVVQKSEEELARIAERKKESGRRLQEQAAKMRLEKLMRKEQELEYYKKLQEKIGESNKKDIKRLLDAEDMKDEARLEKTIRELEKSVKRARTKDVGGDPEEEQEAPDFSLLEVPDDQLDEAQLKTKRHQRLLKSNHEARARAKAEKEAEKARVAEEERLDRERRENDLEGWLEQRRTARESTLARMKERNRLRADLGNRKSLASQIRMKSIANLASDNPRGGGSKRRRGGDDDNFGANDDDWGVYRQIAVGEGGSDDEGGEGGAGGEGGNEDLEAGLRALEEDLLRYDPAFTHEHTWEAQNDWDKSLLHAFLRGPRPFDPARAAETHQLHLNVERVRAPEVVFQPAAVAGVDQAGLVEIVGDVLTQRLAGLRLGLGGGGQQGAEEDPFLRDVFLTGGHTLLRGFDDRLAAGLTPLLPAGAPLRIRRAGDALLDPWRGAASWAGSPAWRAAAVTRAEWQEKGQDYLKEHDMGNTYS